MGILSDISNSVILFIATLTDYSLWRSLGWLMLGLIMIAGGLVLLAKDSAAGVVGRALGAR